MNENIEWLTVLAVEKQTNIPNATIRRYIRNHGHHLNIRKKGKSYFIASESIKIVLNIRKQYDDGKSLEQVEKALIQKGNPVTITVTEEDEQMTVNVGEALQDVKKAVNEQNKIIQSLVEQMQKQQEYINTKLEERDRMLMAAIRETQESKKQIAVAELKKEKQWYQFWKKY
jgi:DNA-binding transcriptional MerR regulator